MTNFVARFGASRSSKHGKANRGVQYKRRLRIIFALMLALIILSYTRNASKLKSDTRTASKRKSKRPVTCECDYPGRFERSLTGFHCSDSSYDGNCMRGTACMKASDQSWPLLELPCSGDRTEEAIMRKSGAFSNHLSLLTPCARTVPGVDEKNAHRCREYENFQLVTPKCSRPKWKVPKLVHSIGKSAEIPFSLQSVLAMNPTFQVNRVGDEGGLAYVRRHCGIDAARAYKCLKPPSYRADLFRFCALSAQGGLYIDEDIVSLRRLEDIVSMCAGATVGHDFPANGHLAKQMKIMASQPNSAIMSCALRSVIANVRVRKYPDSPLNVCGPLLLQSCYAKHHRDVAVTYIDTRNALWPYTGMRAGNNIFAYEVPTSERHFCPTTTSTCKNDDDYAAMFYRRDVYTSDCEL